MKIRDDEDNELTPINKCLIGLYVYTDWNATNPWLYLGIGLFYDDIFNLSSVFFQKLHELDGRTCGLLK